MKRVLWIALALVIAVGIAAPYLDANFMRSEIERALERGLGRKVEVGKVYFNLFTGPGFTIDDVTIYEDPRAGIEPFAYVGALEARVRLLGLLSRRLEFSSLRLLEGPQGEQTSINLTKTDAGPWNFQFLLGSAPAAAGTMPAIKMRGGRVNFKFGDTKSVFYFNDADLEVSPWSDGSVDLRFSGAPSRTDRAQQNFGHFFVRGRWVLRGGTAQRLDMRVELERSAVEEVARLLDRRGFGLHGIVAFDAQLSGPPSQLEIAGQFQIDDVHRWDLLPKRGGGWRVGYKGTLDLRGERLEISSISDTPDPPLQLQFRAWDFLSQPHWDASAGLRQIPLATLMEVARHMGAALSDKLIAEGSVSGAVNYSQPDGLGGHVAVQDASVALDVPADASPGVPQIQRLRAESAALTISGGALSLETTAVRVGENESADIEGRFDSNAGLDLKIATRGLSVADLRSFGLSAIPLLEQTPQGTWRGWARYHWTPGSSGEWSGEYDLQNARIALEGIADPLHIQTASVISTGPRIAVSRLRARIGAVAFTGEYRWDPSALRPHKFRIAIPAADAAELERLLAPTLIRERGFFARTLRLGPAPAPEWLKLRRADGTLSINTLTLGDMQAQITSARLLWDGATVRLARLSGHLDDADLDGELDVDLSGRAPHYRFEGKLQNVPYKGGKLDFDGALEADGADAELLATARGEGQLRGRSIAFTPDAEFRTVAGCFDLLAGVRWKISCLEVTEGAETFTGAGATQADGRLVLDLTNRGRQIRYTGTLAAVTP
jgi:hypothetical protein